MRYILKDNIGTILASIAQAPQDGSMEVIIQEYKSKRSLEANAYYHVVIRDIAKHIGYSPAEVKTITKYALGYFHTIQGKETELMVFDETSKMNVEDMGILIEETLHWGADKGVRFSQPEYAVAVG